MASSVFARRFFTKLAGKSSKILNYNNSTAPYYPSIRDPLKSCLGSYNSPTNIIRDPLKSPTNIINWLQYAGGWHVRDKVRHFSSEKEIIQNLSKDEEEYKKILDQLRQIHYLSPHRKFIDVLPRELNRITPDNFCKLTDVLSKSMMDVMLPCICIVWWSIGEGDKMWFYLSLICFFAIPFVGLEEVRSREYISGLWKQYTQGKMPFQTVALQIIHEVRKSTRRTHIAVPSVLALSTIYAIKFLSS